ncbi:universal stress protein, partial [Streptomyces yangpuensis]|uniref:universal stress protein n=1 Tax=Streptomyces yangpuensis TaxID=1648182 RepID=UPI0036B10DA9
APLEPPPHPPLDALGAPPPAPPPRDEAQPTRYREIVLGVDIHEAADKVLAFAFEEADRRGCAVRAIHGWKMPSMYQYAPFFDPENEREIGRTITVMLDEMLMPWRHKFPSVSATHEAFEGPALEQLFRAAASADLIVVGRRLRRSPLGVHLGSVAHAVLHHAAAPVAVIAHD